MDKYKKLVSNSIIFAMGNFGSKIIAIILVPLYTQYLSTNEYGTVDIVTTTTNMLLPIISLSIYEAVLRFAMDKDESQNAVLTNALMVTILGSCIALLLYPIFRYFNVFDELLMYTYIILIIQAFQSLLSQFTRAIGKVKVFAISGIIQTFILGISNIVLLVFFNYGIKGYLISIILANAVSIIYLITINKFSKYIRFSAINSKLVKNMLQYAIPLIPNAFMWWLINASNRYFILFFSGVSINGIFAVANKIPTLLTIFTSIFSKAWQLSAIEEFDSESKSKFYSQIFYYYQGFLFLATSAILVILKILCETTLAEEYYTAWKYVPFLLLGVVFSSFSGFLGTNYIAAKETKGVFKSSIIGGLSSIILNFMLVPVIGGVGAGISTIISFIIMWIFRINDTKRFIKMTIDIKNLFLSIGIILLQILVLFLNFNSILELCCLVVLFFVLVIFDRKLLLKFLKIKLNKTKS